MSQKLPPVVQWAAAFFIKYLTLKEEMSIVRVNTKMEVSYEQKRTIKKSQSE